MEKFAPELRAYLSERFGSVVRTESLPGVAGQGCTRVHCEHQTVIVKLSAKARERAFYENHATALRSRGISIPQLYHSGCDENGMHYIVIEDIPYALSQDRWTDNPQTVAMLCAFHHATWGDRTPVVEDPFLPEWTDEVTDRAIAWFARSTAVDEIRAGLTTAQTLWHGMDCKQCCISGDPNPTNWRVRHDGSVVLVDWERFGYGAPAIDLAIFIPGLGSADGTLEASIAARYLECWHRSEGEIAFSQATLTAQIRLAKLWTAVDFIASAAKSPELYPKHTVRYVVEHLPNSLKQLADIERDL